MRIVHRSKIDLWLLLIILAAVALAGISCVFAFSAAGARAWWMILLSGGVGIILPIWVLLTTRYTLEGDLLIVQSGPFKWKVPVAEINDITPTRNPLSSPALSLDRLRIEYGDGKSLMVSPEDKEKFIADLDKYLSAIQKIA